jgi:hypothetical protein
MSAASAVVAATAAAATAAPVGRPTPVTAGTEDAASGLALLVATEPAGAGYGGRGAVGAGQATATTTDRQPRRNVELRRRATPASGDDDPVADARAPKAHV